MEDLKISLNLFKGIVQPKTKYFHHVGLICICCKRHTYRSECALLCALVRFVSRKVCQMFDHLPQMGLKLRLVAVLDHGQVI